MGTRTVLLYGESLLLSGLAARLAEHPGLRVARARTWAEASRLLAKHLPDALIFDPTGVCESHVLPRCSATLTRCWSAWTRSATRPCWYRRSPPAR